MELSMCSSFRSSEPNLFRRELGTPLTVRSYRHLPIIRRPTVSVPKTRALITAKKRSPIEGVSEEMNAIASQSLDSASARRRVRSAFLDVQQRLDHCLFKNAPTGIREEEWYEKNSRGLEIFSKCWLPKQGIQMKGSLCFCHGYAALALSSLKKQPPSLLPKISSAQKMGECLFTTVLKFKNYVITLLYGKFGSSGIAKKIAASGYGVYALDYPGFGLSDGLHGYIPSFDELVDDVIEHYTKIKGRPELRGLPHFLLGQSMGGAVTLKAHLKEPSGWDGVILVAPMCKIAEDVTPPAAVLKVLALLSKAMPKAKLFPQKDLAELSFRDSRKRKMAANNVISYNDQMRLRTAVELLKATSEIEMQLTKVSSPLLILHGAADKVTDPLASQFLYEKASSKDKTLKLYEDSYHCILEGEPDDRIFTVLRDIIAWLDSHCSLNQRLPSQHVPSTGGKS